MALALSIPTASYEKGAPSNITRAAIATVRAILSRVTASCRSDRIQSISAARAGDVEIYRALYDVCEQQSTDGNRTMESSPFNGRAIAASQLASQIDNRLSGA